MLCMPWSAGLGGPASFETHRRRGRGEGFLLKLVAREAVAYLQQVTIAYLAALLQLWHACEYMS